MLKKVPEGSKKLGLYKDEELIIMSPYKRIAQISQRYDSASILKNIEIDESSVGEQALAYYQSTNYILKNRLNRW